MVAFLSTSGYGFLQETAEHEVPISLRSDHPVVVM
jgi:hypothetical protein